MKDTIFHILADLQTNASRRIQFDGRDHIAAPVVILVEGVHQGSGGALFYPASVLEASAKFWNGMPVPVHHPEAGGAAISCNSPDIIETRSVGRLWNVRYESSPRPRLKGEIYVDVNKAKRISPAVLDALNNNQPLEVSTGLFSVDESTQGTWNGESYQAVVKDIRPDHLALLPGARGACSWQDGCGVRANKESGGSDMEKKNFLQKMLATVNSAVQLVLGNELSMGEKVDNVRRAIYAMDGPTMDCLVEAIYDNEVVYEVRPGPQSVPGTTAKMCRRGYTIGEDGVVVLSNEIEEVRKEISYVPVSNEESTVVNVDEKIKTAGIVKPSSVIAAQRAAKIYSNANPYHDPATGQFTSGPGGSGSFGSSSEFGSYTRNPSTVHVRSDIGTGRYQASNGRKPSGRGLWAFDFKGDGSSSHTYFVQGSRLYSEASSIAKIKAREWAAVQGSSSVTIEAAP